MTISDLKKRSNNFVQNLDRHIEQIVNYNEDLEALNKQQLKSSKLSNDQSITPPYNRRYAIWKSFAYPSSYADGKVNLYLTGDMYDNIDIKAKGNDYEIVSLLPYVANLITKYSGKIFGIAPSNQNKAKAITTPLLKERYRRNVLA